MEQQLRAAAGSLSDEQKGFLLTDTAHVAALLSNESGEPITDDVVTQLFSKEELCALIAWMADGMSKSEAVQYAAATISPSRNETDAEPDYEHGQGKELAAQSILAAVQYSGDDEISQVQANLDRSSPARKKVDWILRNRQDIPAYVRSFFKVLDILGDCGFWGKSIRYVLPGRCTTQGYHLDYVGRSPAWHEILLFISSTSPTCTLLKMRPDDHPFCSIATKPGQARALSTALRNCSTTSRDMFGRNLVHSGGAVDEPTVVLFMSARPATQNVSAMLQSARSAALLVVGDECEQCDVPSEQLTLEKITSLADSKMIDPQAAWRLACAAGGSAGTGSSKVNTGPGKGPIQTGKRKSKIDEKYQRAIKKAKQRALAPEALLARLKDLANKNGPVSVDDLAAMTYPGGGHVLLTKHTGNLQVGRTLAPFESLLLLNLLAPACTWLQTAFYMLVGCNSSKACEKHGYKPLKGCVPKAWNKHETLSKIAVALNASKSFNYQHSFHLADHLVAFVGAGI